MADKRDPHGIVNFFVRYLVLHVIFLAGSRSPYAMDLGPSSTSLVSMGFFTFFPSAE